MGELVDVIIQALYTVNAGFLSAMVESEILDE